MHGLPIETDQDRIAEWSLVANYLESLASADLPILVHALPCPSGNIPFLTQVGHLRMPAASDDSSSDTVIYALESRGAGGVSGTIRLDTASFVTASLRTLDGDDYFTLFLQFDSYSLLFQDANTW